MRARLAEGRGGARQDQSGSGGSELLAGALDAPHRESRGKAPKRRKEKPGGNRVREFAEATASDQSEQRVEGIEKERRLNMGWRPFPSRREIVAFPVSNQKPEDDCGYDREYKDKPISRGRGVDAAAKHGRTPQAHRADAGQDEDRGANCFKKLRRLHAAESKRKREQGQRTEKKQQQIEQRSNKFSPPNLGRGEQAGKQTGKGSLLFFDGQRASAKNRRHQK